MTNDITSIISSLEIKQILLDTMSHVYTNGIEVVTTYETSRALLSQTLNIYERNKIETPEGISKCYKNNTYSKIYELMQFKQKLDYSKQRALVFAQINRLKMLNFGEKRDVMFPKELLLSEDGIYEYIIF